MGEYSLLIGDIGGTNARFALARDDQPGYYDALTLPGADFESAHAAIEHFLEARNAAPPTVISLAAAGPVVDQTVRFTNNHWLLSVADLARSFPDAAIRLMNDFEATAYSIPKLDENDVMQVGLPEAGSLPDSDYTVGILGPGTGLGTVGLKMVNGEPLPVAGEAGHMGFSPESQVQLDLLAALRERHDRVSAERLISGRGLENIHWALGRMHGQDWPQRSAKEIFEAAHVNSDGRAAEAVHLFFEILGQFAGDFALALGAYDGVYIAGGIVPRYPQLFANSGFRSGFESKGRSRSIMERIPSQLITHENPGLLGAAVVAAQLHHSS